MHRPSSSSLGLAVVAIALSSAGAIGACSAGSDHGSSFGGGGSGSLSNGPLMGSGGGFTTGPSMMSTGPGGDPKTCEQAAMYHTYIGCDFWPTVIANNVWSIFDYAVVVANTGDMPVNATVERGGATVASATVMPNSLAPIYLPWVPELKGPDFDASTAAVAFPGSVQVAGGAYHLTTNLPVTVYQFSAIEYAGDASKGGPPGKNWSSCPGMGAIGCFSYSNDASLLLPSTAMTGNYRVTAHEGWVDAGFGPVMGPTMTITGTADGTSVTVNLSATGHVIGGGSIADTPGGGSLTLQLGAGDVAELASDPNGDFSGSVIQATHPVQVLNGVPCIDIPSGSQACDHIEESNLPAETLGKHYFVTLPSGPNAAPVGQVVKIYGNRDGTALTYPAGVMPAGAPSTLNAGQVVDLGVVMQDFEIKGDHEFAVSTFQTGASLADPGRQPPNQKGDPAQSQAIAVEQYRTKYVFLAPTDYDVNFVDVIAPSGASVTLDTVPVPATLFQAIGSSGYGIAHLSLVSSNLGAHVLESTRAAGIQVMGYGAYTSYQYPGGLNLSLIAPPPPPH